MVPPAITEVEDSEMPPSAAAELMSLKDVRNELKSIGLFSGLGGLNRFGYEVVEPLPSNPLLRSGSPPRPSRVVR